MSDLDKKKEPAAAGAAKEQGGGGGVTEVVVREVEGDLLECAESALCHQCNCVTTTGAHLSAAVFRRFPHADIYRTRTKRDVPGTIVLRGDPSKAQRFVINMLGQLYPGKSRYANDSAEKRLQWFQSCLDGIGKLVKT